MKEVKEQCEERIEEVTKKGNEAVASRDLSEQKDQSQQVILAFFCQGSPKGLPTLSSGISFLHLLSDSLQFPDTWQPGPGTQGLWRSMLASRPGPRAPGRKAIASFKAHSHPGSCFLVWRALRPMEAVRNCPKVTVPGQWGSWSERVLSGCLWKHSPWKCCSQPSGALGLF